MLEDSPLIEAIALWEELTGVAPPDEKGYWSSSGGMNTWAIRDTYTALKEALELDPTEITASLLLKRFLEEYLKEAKSSLNDMLRNPEQAMKQMTAAKKLLDILDRPEIVEARDAFIEGLRRGLAAYGADQRDDIKAVLAKPDDIAVLRRDALRSLANLRCDQFLDGDSEAADYKPVYVNDVHLWWNVNSLLKAMTGLPSGVSLNLIRDPNAYESYFAFAIRNGANLFVMTDVPEHAHPLQASMTRKPGRDFDRRAAKNWFPYDLLGMQVDEKGDSVKPTHSSETAVVLHQEHTIPMMKIGEVPAYECIWITMMLDLLVTKFWKVGFKAKQLSYTGEMILMQDTLLLEATKANLPALVDKPLEMPVLAVADVLTDVVAEKAVGRKHGRNRHLEERYKDKINPAILNVIEQGGATVLLPSYTPEYKSDKVPDGVALDGGLKRLSSSEVATMGHFAAKHARSHSLAVLSATRFGTPEELEADRLFIARHNMATQIGVLAHEEFEQREKEVMAWFEKAARKNLPAILSWCGNEEIWLGQGVRGTFDFSEVGGPQRVVKIDSDSPFNQRYKSYRSLIKRKNILEERRTKDYDFSSFGAVNLGGFRQDYVCAVNDTMATYKVVFHPASAEELAVLLGLAVSDLPDVLQNWSLDDRYMGNSILDRIDPMDWHLRDPWRRKSFKLLVPLSIRALRKLEKAPALPPLANIVTREEVYADRKERADAFERAAKTPVDGS